MTGEVPVLVPLHFSLIPIDGPGPFQTHLFRISASFFLGAFFSPASSTRVLFFRSRSVALRFFRPIFPPIGKRGFPTAYWLYVP